MKQRIFLSLLLVLLISANIFSIKIKKSEIPVTEDASLNEDYLFAGDELNFSGKADDLLFFGRELFFSGKTDSSLFAIGEKIKLEGDIANNLYGASNDIEINGNVEDSVFMAGKDVTINKGTLINGSVITAGKNIRILGNINGDLIVGAGILTIDGRINGNVKAAAGNIKITENGTVLGNFDYRTDYELNSEEKSRIRGNISFKKSKHLRDKNLSEFKKSFNIIAFVLFKIFVLISFIIGGLLVLLFPYTKKLEEERSAKQFWFSSLWGLIPFLIYPVVIFLLIILGITFPLAIIMALAGLPILFITKIFGVTMLGQYLFKTFKWNNTKRFLFFLFGIIFYTLLILIPGIGFLAMIFFSSLGWGFVLEQLFNRTLTE